MKLIKFSSLIILFLSVFVLFQADIVAQKAKSKKTISKTKKVNVKPVTATLNFEAGILYQFGGMQKMARVTFLLLNKDLQEIFNSQTPALAQTLQRQYKLGELAVKIDQNANGNNAWKWINEKVSPHIVASATTDFDGRGQFAQIKPGNYYLVYYGISRGVMTIWNESIQLNAGNNQIILDQNNAEFSQ